MRTMAQPGPVQEPRILVSTGEAARNITVSLGPGTDLLNGIRDAVDAEGGGGAAVELLGGSLSGLHYFTGMPDPTGQRLATYGDPTHLQGPVTLLSGNAIVGTDAEGAPLVHAHAVMVDPEGRVHGGHLPPGGCTVGEGGARALVALHTSIQFAVQDDPETNYSIFHPMTTDGSEPDHD